MLLCGELGLKTRSLFYEAQERVKQSEVTSSCGWSLMRTFFKKRDEKLNSGKSGLGHKTPAREVLTVGRSERCSLGGVGGTTW